ncbi:MAG: hypothetical protein ACRCVW_03115 [Brevinema sp.]
MSNKNLTQENIKEFLTSLERLTGTISYWLDLINDSENHAGCWVAQTTKLVFSFGLSALIEIVNIKNNVEQLNSLLNDILSNLESEFGKTGLKNLGYWFIELSKINGLGDLKIIGDIILNYANNGPNLLWNVFKLIFDQWAVFVLPIPLPTWVHYTDSWGKIPHWQYLLGVPVVHTFDEDNIK